jgi:hypothetical protein
MRILHWFRERKRRMRSHSSGSTGRLDGNVTGGAAGAANLGGSSARLLVADSATRL